MMRQHGTRRVAKRKPEMPLRMEIAPGIAAAHDSHTVIILEPINGSEVRVRDVATGAEQSVPVSELSGISLGLSRADIQHRWESVRSSTREEWLRARRRERVIRRLIRGDGAAAKEITLACRALGLSRSSVYRLLTRYRQAAQTSSLLVGHRGTPRQHRRLSVSREAIATRAIEEKFLARPRMTISQLTEEIRNRCLRAALKPVSRKAIEMRIALLDPRLVRRGRHGAKAARDAFGLVGGVYDVTEPLAVMQIDHTPVDAIVVDSLTRKAIARPWLTLAIDVATRVVMGMSVTLEALSIHSVSLALTHACLPKTRWIADRGLDVGWDAWGLPKALHMDNAREFKSEAVRRGCDEYGIKKIFRPIARPHFGGHIERLIGTLMGRVHLLPGTTSSNVAERGDYDSAKSATMTLAELESWLALEIAGRYHRQTHRALGISPLAAWEAAREHGFVPSLPADARQFSLHFLPMEMRALRKDGIHLFNIRYCSERLPLIARPGDDLVVRYDPRNLGRVYVLGRDGDYHDIVYADVRHPPISLWEQRFARACLRSQQRRVDESGIFKVLDQQRAIVAEAARATRTARQRGPTLRSKGPEVTPVNYELPAQELESELLGPRR
jgi:putative transposase